MAFTSAHDHQAARRGIEWMREHYRRGRRRIGSCRIFFLAMSARGSCNGGGARMVDAFERFERRIGERRRGTRNPAEQHNAFLICNRNGRFNDLFEPPTRAFALPPTSIATPAVSPP